MVLGMTVSASAADLQASGSLQFVLGWVNDADFDKTDAEDDMILQSRLRTSFSYIASENLKAVLQLEAGTDMFGATGLNQFKADSTDSLEVKSLYLNFVWPNTDIGFFVGLMPIALPGGPGGNPVLDDDMAGAAVTTPLTENVSVLAGFSRLYASADKYWDVDGEDKITSENLDAWFIALPISADGVSATPYYLHAYTGSNFFDSFTVENFAATFPGLLTQTDYAAANLASTTATFNYAGSTYDISLLDPVNIAGSFVYGDLDVDVKNDSATSKAASRSGWFADAQLKYTANDFVTPSLYFSYSTGENDDDADGSERLPQISSGLAGMSSFFLGGDAYDGAYVDADVMGFWSVGLVLEDISFVEGLTHKINLLYFAGTNDKSIAGDNNAAYGKALTKEDSLWELDLNSTYQVYDELTAVVNLGYMKADYDDEVWTSSEKETNASKVVFGLQYSF